MHFGIPSSAKTQLGHFTRFGFFHPRATYPVIPKISGFKARRRLPRKQALINYFQSAGVACRMHRLYPNFPEISPNVRSTSGRCRAQYRVGAVFESGWRSSTTAPVTHPKVDQEIRRRHRARRKSQHREPYLHFTTRKIAKA